jgi:plastocyanin
MTTCRRVVVKCALLVVAVLTPAVTGCGGDDDGGESAACPADAVTIAMKGQSFDPSRASAKVGQTICWPNESLFAHDVVAESGADFRSREYDEGEKPFTIVVKKPGRIAYVCTLHAGMVGAIEVTR